MSQSPRATGYKRNCVRPTIGVLAGWQFYRTATTFSYLAPLYQGISRAAQELGCNLMLGCGMGPSASLLDPTHPAWPLLYRHVFRDLPPHLTQHGCALPPQLTMKRPNLTRFSPSRFGSPFLK